ncbi:glycosyltransferase family 2 protein [Fictibacillus iocasae]|uniref:Glycosyltransferase family 2 protein n=1 Tax=Fictibacillus iocasae TaxID=2715437 RepID=A0ABW2NPH6_9BACL
MPDTGVVMPVYNQVPHILKAALLSILEQTYKQFRLVIVIDGANSLTRKTIFEIIKDQNDVIVLDKKNNEGVSKALNTGFQHLIGYPDIQYLTWVSSDNIYYPNFLEALRNKLAASPPHIGLVYSSFRHISANGHPTQDEAALKRFRQFQHQTRENLLNICFIGVSFMYRKSAAIKIEGYHFEPVEDYEYWLRLTEVCDITYLAQELMDYRVDAPESISKSLHENKQRHRWWRHQFNLARQQARMRRGIPIETTIFYPAPDTSDATIDALERLLNQSYYNYRLVIVDETGMLGARLDELKITDPRIERIASNDKMMVLRNNVHTLKTAYAMIYGPSLPNDQSLSHLVKIMKSLPFSKVHIAYIDSLKKTPQLRPAARRQIPGVNELLYSIQFKSLILNSRRMA